MPKIQQAYIPQYSSAIIILDDKLLHSLNGGNKGIRGQFSEYQFMFLFSISKLLIKHNYYYLLFF